MRLYVGVLKLGHSPQLFTEVFSTGWGLYQIFGNSWYRQDEFFHSEFISPPIPLEQYLISRL